MRKHTLVANEKFIFDAHCDTVNTLYDHSSSFRSEKKSHLNAEKAKRGGLNAQIFALYVNPVYAPHRAIKKALLLYTTLENKVFSFGNAVKVTSTPEMNLALKEDKLACWLSLEGGHIIENSIEILEFFYRLGIRCMTLTHSKNTDWADSCADKPRHDGLNVLGGKIVKKMNELGMVIDVSHCADKTVEDVLEITSLPIMASHSNARALCDIPRNLPDDLIQEIAKRKGYIGVNFYPAFLQKKIYEQVLKNIAKQAEWFEERTKGNENDPDIVNTVESELYPKLVKGNDTVDLQAVVDHIVHIADIGGIDCVGLGSDFDGIPSTPVDLPDVSCYPALAEGLALRGFQEKEIHKIMGLNLTYFLQHFDR